MSKKLHFTILGILTVGIYLAWQLDGPNAWLADYAVFTYRLELALACALLGFALIFVSRKYLRTDQYTRFVHRGFILFSFFVLAFTRWWGYG